MNRSFVVHPVSSRRARLTAGLGALLASAGLLAAGAGGGCASSLTHRDANLVVVEPSGAPVPGATVRADPVVARHPLNLGDYLRGEHRTLGQWTTGPDGRAVIVVLQDKPTELTVVAPGFLPVAKLIEPSAQSEMRLELSRVELPAAAAPAR